jgi:hypothetical protein
VDFIDQLIQNDAPVAREVKFAGPAGVVKGTVHFRRVTAGERQRLFKGQKYAMNKEGAQTTMRTEIDLELNETQKHLLVMYSVCREDGSAVFKSTEEVRKLDAVKLNALYEIADEVNRDLDPGKA